MDLTAPLPPSRPLPPTPVPPLVTPALLAWIGGSAAVVLLALIGLVIYAILPASKPSSPVASPFSPGIRTELPPHTSTPDPRVAADAKRALDELAKLEKKTRAEMSEKFGIGKEQADDTPDIPWTAISDPAPLTDLPFEKWEMPEKVAELKEPRLPSRWRWFEERDVVEIWDACRGQKAATFPHPGIVQCCVRSDGAFIAISRPQQRNIEIYRADGGSVRTIPLTDPFFFDFGADNRLVSVTVKGNPAKTRAIEVQLSELEGDAPPRAFPLELLGLTRGTPMFALSPGGRYLAVFYVRFEIWDLQTEKRVNSVRLPGKPFANGYSNVCFSPDGREVAVAVRDILAKSNRLIRWALADGRVAGDRTIRIEGISSWGQLTCLPDSSAWILNRWTLVPNDDRAPTVWLRQTAKNQFYSIQSFLDGTTVIVERDRRLVIGKFDWRNGKGIE